MIPQILSSIKPAYPDSVHYSKPGDPLACSPSVQQDNKSVYSCDAPVCEVDMEENDRWAHELAKAAQECSPQLELIA